MRARIKTFWNRYKSNKAAVVGLIIVIVIAFMAVFAPYIALDGPHEFSDAQLESPSLRHPMGTDNFGRDIYSRIVWGSRVAILISTFSAALSLVLGILLGSIPAYYGGLIDDLFARIFDIFLVIPRFVICLLIVSLFGSNIFFVTFVIGITMWPANARIIRSQVLSLKNRSYVQAAKGMGAGMPRLLFRHIVPNGMYTVLTNSALQMALALLIEAGLSFLGLGDPSAMSWGQMLYAARPYFSIAWWMALCPGMVLTIFVCGLNLVGDGINHALNPRLWER